MVRKIEHKLIEIIESLDRIMASWEQLTLRRTILIVFTILLFIQIIITFILWVIGRDISNTWLGVLSIQFGAWGTMLGFYFSVRGKDGERNE